ncbi:MAG: histidine phosphatase family protein [Candidatus Hodarchaeota archaeon]
MRLVLVRHGESEGNSKGIIQGHTDFPLTGRGRAQARDLAQRILAKNIHFDLCYSSDLSRAAETAKIVANILNLDVLYTPLLREFNLGVLEGHKWDELCADKRDFLDSVFKDHTKQIPKGENINQMVTRLQTFLEQLRQLEPQPSSVLIVCHGGSIFHILTTILKIFEPPTNEWYENCHMNEIVKDPESAQWQLISFNEKEIEKTPNI